MKEKIKKHILDKISSYSAMLESAVSDKSDGFMRSQRAELLAAIKVLKDELYFINNIEE